MSLKKEQKLGSRIESPCSSEDISIIFIMPLFYDSANTFPTSSVKSCAFIVKLLLMLGVPKAIPGSKAGEDSRDLAYSCTNAVIYHRRGYKAKSARGKGTLGRVQETRCEIPRVLSPWSHTGHNSSSNELRQGM